jgi:hypothetical protein
MNIIYINGNKTKHSAIHNSNKIIELSLITLELLTRSAFKVLNRGFSILFYNPFSAVTSTLTHGVREL